jgi:hypothetical protein
VEQKTRVVAALVEGNSVRSTVRLTGVAKNTVIKLLLDLADASAAYHDIANDLPIHVTVIDDKKLAASCTRTVGHLRLNPYLYFRPAMIVRSHGLGDDETLNLTPLEEPPKCTASQVQSLRLAVFRQALPRD